MRVCTLPCTVMKVNIVTNMVYGNFTTSSTHLVCFQEIYEDISVNWS